jgi:hypothetical protein
MKAFSSTAAASTAAIAKAFPSIPHGTTVEKVPKDQQLGFWVALGKVENPAMFDPKETAPLSPAMIQQAYQHYQTANPTVQKWIAKVQSGGIMDAYRSGHSVYDGLDLKKATKAAVEFATEKPAGTKIWRWQNMTPSMVAKMLSTPPGTIIQATGPMCSSYHPTATKSFGSHEMEIIYAPGAKAVTSFGSGNYSSEYEVTTLPNARFVLLGATKKPNGTVKMRVLMLPPDPGL